MKIRKLLLVIVLLSMGLSAAGVRAGDAKPGRDKLRTVQVIHSWSGIPADGALRKHRPADGLVLGQETWDGLWRKWRGGEKAPILDFRQQMVLVFTAEGPNSVGYDKVTLDGRGDVRVNVMSTLIGGPGFGYLILCIPREGVKSVQGKPLPGTKAPPKKPRPPRPFGKPGAVPGYPGGAPAEPGPSVEIEPFEGARPQRPISDPGVVASPLPPITELAGIRPKRSVWEGSTWKKPRVLTSEKEAAEFFERNELAKLTRQVDFGRQFVLLFVWRGSGQDRLSAAVAESYPEQVFFSYQPGRTRDLVEHVRVYALRSNVGWRLRE